MKILIFEYKCVLILQVICFYNVCSLCLAINNMSKALQLVGTSKQNAMWDRSQLNPGKIDGFLMIRQNFL